MINAGKVLYHNDICECENRGFTFYLDISVPLGPAKKTATELSSLKRTQNKTYPSKVNEIGSFFF